VGELRVPGEVDVEAVVVPGNASGHLLELATRGAFELIAAGSQTAPGVPLYIPYRIGLCRKLRRDGWTREEIFELVEWEEWTVTDRVDGDLPHEDDDRRTVLNEFREHLEMLESERVATLAVRRRRPSPDHRGTERETVLLVRMPTLPIPDRQLNPKRTPRSTTTGMVGRRHAHGGNADRRLRVGLVTLQSVVRIAFVQTV